MEEIADALITAEKEVIKKANLSIVELDGEFLFGTSNPLTRN